MPKRKPKTQAQTDRATDARLQKTYGVTLAWYDSQLEKQGGGCAICGTPPGARRLHVDHDHSWTKVKVVSRKMGKVWEAAARYLNCIFYGSGRTKSIATRQVKAKLKRASVRGLLCYRCNSGLQKYRDQPKRFRTAADYLEDHQGS